MTDTKKRLLVPAIVTILLLAGVYLVFAAAGATARDVLATNDYSRLAEGFLNGHLSLMRQPSAALLAEPDPYDPSGHFPHEFLFDGVLYHGKYYLYWGPVPALIEAAVCRVLGILHPTLNDRPIAVAFMCGTDLLAAILIFKSRSRFFPEQPLSTGFMALLSLAMGFPVLFCIESAAVNETAIMSGQFFLLAGILAAWTALCRGAVGTSGRSPLIPATAAGLCWAAAAASRVSLPPAMLALTAWTAWKFWNADVGKSRARTLSAVGLLTGSLVAGLMFTAWYNEARFGSITEFGVHYQLTGVNQSEPVRSGLVGLHNVPYNVDADLMNPPILMHVFPYFYVSDSRAWVATHLRLPRYFLTQPHVGLIWSQPFLLFAAVALLGELFAARTAKPEQSERRWLIVALAAAAMLGIAPALFIAWNATRYLLDAVPCLSILAAIGYWRILDYLKPHPRLTRELRSAAWILVAAQSVMAVLLTISANPFLTRILR